MTNDLEDRLAALEKELAKTRSTQPDLPEKPRKIRPSKRKYLKVRIVTCLLLLLALIGGGFFYIVHGKPKAHSPLPPSLIASSSFPIYYPNPVPEGYTFAPNSVSSDSGTIFCKLKNGDREILIIQQANPNSNLMLDSTVGLDPIDTPNGKAYVGKNKASPVGIIQTKSTLVNITGSADVPSDVINSIMRDLKPLD